MLTRTELTALMVTMPEIIKPVTVTLACGHSVLNEAGTEIFKKSVKINTSEGQNFKNVTSATTTRRMT